jgi:hypothetical protein
MIRLVVDTGMFLSSPERTAETSEKKTMVMSRQYARLGRSTSKPTRMIETMTSARFATTIRTPTLAFIEAG